jgi:hypothetical protein
MTSFVLGDYRCTYLNVGSFELDADTLFGDVPAGEFATALERHELDPELMVFQVRALLVDTGAGRVAAADGGWCWQPEELG